MEEKKKVMRYIVKEDGKNVMVAEYPDGTIVKIIQSKEVFRKNYEDLKKNQIQHRDQLAFINKKIKENEHLGEDKELESFLIMADRAARYNEYKKHIQDRENNLSLLNELDEQVAKMEKAAPELKRVKKK